MYAQTVPPDPVTFNFDKDYLTGAPGDTVQFYGFLHSNADPEVSVDGELATVYASSATWGGGALEDKSLVNLPYTIGAATTGQDIPIALFTFKIPGAANIGDTVSGEYTVAYDVDKATTPAVYTVQVEAAPVPEPAFVQLAALLGCSGLGLIRRKR